MRPGLTEPAFAARTAATLDRLSNGRLLINVVTGGDPVELKGDGVFLDHDERYEVTDEFLSIWRKLMQGEEVTGDAQASAESRRASCSIRRRQQPYPPLYFGGSSGAGSVVAAKHVDVYLTWGEPPKDVAEKIAAAKAVAAQYGRTFSFGIRLHVIVRETSAEAWRAADALIAKLDDDTIATAQKAFARFDSVGQQRMARLHGGRRDKLEISPNLWAGVGLVRGGAGTALVGNPDEVADRMKEYMALGIDRFILSGYPHLEECYRFAELVFPKLPLKATTGNDLGPAKNAGPFGEIIANVVAPSRTKSGGGLRGKLVKPMAKEIRLNAFEMNCVAHQSPGLWRHPRDRSRDYRRLKAGSNLRKHWSEGSSTVCFSPTFSASTTSLAAVPRRPCGTRRRPRSTIRCCSSRPWRPPPSTSASASPSRSPTNRLSLSRAGCPRSIT